MNRGLLLIGLLIAWPPRAGAQNADQTKDLIQSLMARIERLETRLAQLEHPAPAAAPPVAPPVATAQAVHMAHDTPPVPDAAQPAYPALKLSGFSDFNFSATDLHGPSGGFGTQTLLGAHSGFQEGQFALHLSAALSPKVNVFGELSLTARADAGTGSPPATGFNAEVERLIVRYDLNDYFKISFGRYHTPINYWNTAYHHGQWLQTTASRPEMTQFGGGFIPVHFIGTLVEGSASAGGLNLNYNVGLGNGRGQVLGRGGDIGDINNSRAWLVNAFIKPDRLYGLQIGGSVYRDLINPFNGQPAREWIQSAHIVWHKETPEVIAEFANVTHQPVSGTGTSNAQAFYVQTAYRLPWGERLWKPYYRMEYLHIPLADTIFRGVPSFSSSTVGARYDISSFAAFKLEYRNYSRRNLPDIRGDSANEFYLLGETMTDLKIPISNAPYLGGDLAAGLRFTASGRCRYRDRGSAGRPVDNLTFAELRRIMIGDRQFWTSNLRVTLLVRSPGTRERDVVLKKIYKMSEAQFRQYWIAKVFRAEAPAGQKSYTPTKWPRNWRRRYRAQ